MWWGTINQPTIINLFVIGTQYLVQQTLVKKLSGCILYDHTYLYQDHIVHVFIHGTSFMEYHIHVHIIDDVQYKLFSELKAHTVVTILYSVDDKDSLQLANRQISNIRLVNPTISILLVAISNKDSKHLVPSAIYRMTDDCTSFVEKDIWHREIKTIPGDVTGNLYDFIELVVEQVKNPTGHGEKERVGGGNAVADIDLLMKKIVKGKDSYFGWD